MRVAARRGVSAALLGAAVVAVAFLGRKLLPAEADAYARIMVVVMAEPRDAIDPWIAEAVVAGALPKAPPGRVRFFSVETPALRVGEPFDARFPTLEDRCLGGYVRFVLDAPSEHGFAYRLGLNLPGMPELPAPRTTTPTRLQPGAVVTPVSIHSADGHDCGTLVVTIELATEQFSTTPASA